MRVIQCPNCENELAEHQVQVKGGQSEPGRGAKWKLKCRICCNTWRAKDSDFYDKAGAAPLQV